MDVSATSESATPKNVTPALHVVDRREHAAVAVAAELGQLVRERAAAGRRAVLGLATGGTMVPVYAELVRLHREEGLDFAGVETFNLDEYVGLDASHPASFAHFMREHLFDPVGLPPERAHVPDGVLARADAEGATRGWEERIRDAGGLDVQLLGLGRNGHIAFNEPGAGRETRTRIVELHDWTRADNAKHFDRPDAVPRRAITAGVATILDARRILVLAFGAAKAGAVRAVLQGPVGPSVPGSFVREHPDVVFWLDRESAVGVDGT